MYFGSALTGAGIDVLLPALAEFLPATDGDTRGTASAAVFKIERGAAGEKIAYARMFSGTLRRREQVAFGRGEKQRVTALQVFERGGAVDRAEAVAGEIAKVWGLAGAQVGDAIGPLRRDGGAHQFAPPALETVVTPRDPGDGARLRLALVQLAEQDPLIAVRQNDAFREMSVSLYGEVQKEVIGTTLRTDYGIDVIFRETTTICIERPVGTGSALEVLQSDANPFSATVGLRVEPAAPGAGVAFAVDGSRARSRSTSTRHRRASPTTCASTSCAALREGLFGWQVTDCDVTMTRCGYYVGDGPGKPSGGTTRTNAADFRRLTPLVLMRALRRAGTVVCEPMVRARIEVPSESVGAVVALVARVGGTIEPATGAGDLPVIDAVMPAARVHELQRQLPSVSGGEAVAEPRFGGYAPVPAPPLRRPTAQARSARRRDPVPERPRAGTPSPSTGTGAPRPVPARPARYGAAP